MRNMILLSFAAIVVAGGGGLIGYLDHFDHETAPVLLIDSPTRRDPVATAAFDALREARCDYCHVPATQLPFYAGFPVAHQLMSHDVRQGLRHFEFAPVLDALQSGQPVPEEKLSRIEMVIRQGRMLPQPYTDLHWHARLDATETKAILTWIDQSRQKYYAATPPRLNTDEPVRPLPESVPVDSRKAALGQRLFFETRLSGDGTFSCASCHSLTTGGVNHTVVSIGIDGRKGVIRAPTVFNALFNFAQFWDGRATTRAAQAAGPVMNPVEMGSHDWNQVAGKLQGDPGYRSDFQAAFGSDEIDQQTITDAIQEFEKTLITPDSRFDRYLRGDTTALSQTEAHGYQLFKDVGCASCHVGNTLGGQSFEIMGLYANYFADRGTPVTVADLGRYNVTHQPSDRFRFKVPQLRNVALTAPYFHDGSAKTLHDAVVAMVKYQTPSGTLAEQDVDDIVAFLKTLTGDYKGKPLTATQSASR